MYLYDFFFDYDFNSLQYKIKLFHHFIIINLAWSTKILIKKTDIMKKYIICMKICN